MFSDVTEVEILKCEIEWKLFDFYKHETFMENGQFLTSKQFYNPKCPSIKWELRIYPNNNPEDPRSLISLVQVGLENSDDSLKAQFYIYTLDNKGEKVFCSLGNTFSFKNQIESDKYELRRRTVPNSPLIIFCDVEFVPYKIKLENEFVDYSTPKNSFMEIFKHGILTDCVFEIGDEKINAHKCILANYSIVFQKMFEQKNMKEAKSGKIKIVDTSPECFKIMLEYFYSGEIDKKTFEKYSEDLFAIAHKYEVKQLMELCENYMAANIDAANFSDRCNYAELYSLLKLEKACFNYFSTNRSTFILSKEWNKFKINNKDFAFRLLEETHDFGEKYDSPTIKKVKEARRFTEIQKRILVQKFSEQRYLNSIDRDDMAIKTGLTGSQVMSWFQQRRAIWKRNTRRINLL